VPREGVRPRLPPPVAAGRSALVADSDPGVGRLLGRDLPAQGFSVTLSELGSAVLSEIASSRPDAVIIGGGMADRSFLELVRAVHRPTGPPVLALLSNAKAAAVIEVLDAGADDCMGKPFLVEELAARLRKLVRQTLVEHGLPPLIRSGALEIDCVRWHVRLGGRDVALSAKENTILRMLVEEAGKVISTREMLRHIWGNDRLDRAGRVRQLVGRLRGKLGMTPDNPVYIRTEPQGGYRLLLPPNPAGGFAGGKASG
jgi:two-component system KDP operon response regulator KdpE